MVDYCFTLFFTNVLWKIRGGYRCSSIEHENLGCQQWFGRRLQFQPHWHWAKITLISNLVYHPLKFAYHQPTCSFPDPSRHCDLKQGTHFTEKWTCEPSNFPSSSWNAPGLVDFVVASFVNHPDDGASPRFEHFMAQIGMFGSFGRCSQRFPHIIAIIWNKSHQIPVFLYSHLSSWNLVLSLESKTVWEKPALFSRFPSSVIQLWVLFWAKPGKSHLRYPVGSRRSQVANA